MTRDPELLAMYEYLGIDPADMVPCWTSACGDCGSPVLLNGAPGSWVHINGGPLDCDPVNTPGYIAPSITTDSPEPLMPCRECDGTGVSPHNPSLICGTCDGTREDPDSPIWQATS